MEAKNYPSVYRYSYDYATRHGEFEAWEKSRAMNAECAARLDAIMEIAKDSLEYDSKPIEKLVNEIDGVLDQFGVERVSFVLAATVGTLSNSPHLSGANKQLPREQDFPEFHSVMDTYGYILQSRSRPDVLNDFLNVYQLCVADRSKDVSANLEQEFLKKQNEYYEMRKDHTKELCEDYTRIQEKGREMGFQPEHHVDFSLSAYWFNVEIEEPNPNGGSITPYYFKCDSLDALKEAITYVVNETKFYETTAFVEGCSYVTFRSQAGIDADFDRYYRSYFRFTEDMRETYPELIGVLFTKSQVKEVYHSICDMKEYVCFDDWLQDMCKSGLIYSCDKNYVPAGSKKERSISMEINEEKNEIISYPPLYKEDILFAKEHGETEAFRSSTRLNDQCAAAIDKAITGNYDGMRLNKDAVTSVVKEFGAERVSFVLAATVLYKRYDGRFSPHNRAWAADICPPKMVTDIENGSADIWFVRPTSVIGSHPAVLNGFIDIFRKEVKQIENVAAEGHLSQEETKQPDTKTPNAEERKPLKKKSR